MDILFWIIFGALGEPQVSVCQEFGNRFVRSRYRAQSQLGAVFDWQYHVQRPDRGHFLDQLPTAVPKPFALHPHFQGTPHGQG